MRAFPILITAASVLLQNQHVQAGPITGLPDLVSRGPADLLLEILKLFRVVLKDDADIAWDYKSHPQMCSVYMETVDGGHCRALVDCDDGRKEYNVGGATWNVCYVGGRQYFTDPRIGEFSITFQERDGSGQGEGLTTPKLQLKYVGDWKDIPVNTAAQAFQQYQRCNDRGGLGGDPLRVCDKGP